MSMSPMSFGPSPIASPFMQPSFTPPASVPVANPMLSNPIMPNPMQMPGMTPSFLPSAPDSFNAGAMFPSQQPMPLGQSQPFSSGSMGMPSFQPGMPQQPMMSFLA